MNLFCTLLVLLPFPSPNFFLCLYFASYSIVVSFAVRQNSSTSHTLGQNDIFHFSSSFMAKIKSKRTDTLSVMRQAVVFVALVCGWLVMEVLATCSQCTGLNCNAQSVSSSYTLL